MTDLLTSADTEAQAELNKTQPVGATTFAEAAHADLALWGIEVVTGDGCQATSRCAR